jgi:hypothetical protein
MKWPHTVPNTRNCFFQELEGFLIRHNPTSVQLYIFSVFLHSCQKMSEKQRDCTVRHDDEAKRISKVPTHQEASAESSVKTQVSARTKYKFQITHLILNTDSLLPPCAGRGYGSTGFAPSGTQILKKASWSMGWSLQRSPADGHGLSIDFVGRRATRWLPK